MVSVLISHHALQPAGYGSGISTVKGVTGFDKHIQNSLSLSSSAPVAPKRAGVAVVTELVQNKRSFLYGCCRYSAHGNGFDTAAQRYNWAMSGNVTTVWSTLSAAEIGSALL